MVTNMRIIKDIVKYMNRKKSKYYIIDFLDSAVIYKCEAIFLTELNMFYYDYFERNTDYSIVVGDYYKTITTDTSKMAVLEAESIRIINGTKCLSLYNIDTNCYTDIKMEYIEKISNFEFDNTMVFKQTYNSKDLVYIYRKKDMELLAIITPYIRK